MYGIFPYIWYHLVVFLYGFHVREIYHHPMDASLGKVCPCRGSRRSPSFVVAPMPGGSYLANFSGLGRPRFLHMGVEPKKRGKTPKMDGLSWKTLLKWMIWGYPYFWKHPYIWRIIPCNLSKAHHVLGISLC